MNKVQLTGRLTADPEIKVYNNENGDVYVARYSLAVPRRFKKDEADFFRCVSFGKTAQFLEKYMNKGFRQDRWKDKDGKDRSAVVVVIDEVEFGQSKAPEAADNDGFMNIPAGIDEDVPFGSDEEIVTERIKSFMDDNDYSPKE